MIRAVRTACIAAATLLVALPAGTAAQAAPEAVERPDLARWLEGHAGTFVALDPARDTVFRLNPARAATRFTPVSTFKIPNTVIALETGVVDGPDFALAWDSIRDPRQPEWPATWWKDQTLATALPNSVVWFYRELARRIGAERMRAHMDRFDYGNGDLSGGLDRFWLESSLAISADEQVDFLRRLRGGELGVSGRSLALLDQLLELGRSGECRIYGKTGTAEVGTERELGWLVGWVRCGDRLSYYAFNVEGGDVWEVWKRDKRLAAVQAMLAATGFVP